MSTEWKQKPTSRPCDTDLLAAFHWVILTGRQKPLRSSALNPRFDLPAGQRNRNWGLAHFLGKADKNITVESAERMKAAIEKVGSRCDVHLYEGQEHGFFNYGRSKNRYYELTLIETDKFLTSLGWITGQPTLESSSP